MRHGATIGDGIRAARAGDRRALIEVALQQAVFGALPLFLLALLLVSVLGGSHPALAFDFSHAYWSAAHRLIAGVSPYDWTAGQARAGLAFVYPAASAVAFVPLLALQRTAAAVLVTFVWIGLAPLALYLLGVRDWRVYGVTLLWGPFFGSWQTGNESMLLALLVALAWRYRDRPWVAAALTAAAISLKPFVWPLALWLLATRRGRAFAYTACWSIAFNLAAWSLVGFNQIPAYLHAASLDTHYAWRANYSIAAAVGRLGGSYLLAVAVTVLISGALAVAVLRAGLIKRREREALTLTVAVMLAASPIVWNHYFMLLLVPLAICSPQLGRLWMLPVLMWVCPAAGHTHAWQQAVAWAVAGLILAALARGSAQNEQREPVETTTRSTRHLAISASG